MVMDFIALVHECSPSVPMQLMQSLVHQESSFNPYAIGLDANQGAVKQPSSLDEAIETVQKLKKDGRTFSVGLAQIHISNVERYGMTLAQAFDPCTNLHTSELILWDYYKQAIKSGYENTSALWAMLRGYNSGNINGDVSNKYASAILSRANNLKDMVVTTKINYKISSDETLQLETEQDIFSDKDNSKDIFNSSR